MPRRNLDLAAGELLQVLGQLVRRVRAAGAGHDLSLTESAVLARLSREGPATTAELARAEGIKPQSMGTTVAVLEELGLVEREPHPTDGRQWHVGLTAKGAALRKSTRDAKQTWLAQAMARLEENDRETLFQAGEILRRLLEEEER